MVPSDRHRAPDRTSRWDLPIVVQKSPDPVQSAYCRKIAHRYTQAKYASLGILGLVNLYLWYEVLIGEQTFGGGSFPRMVLVLLPWLAATIGFGVSFHQRADHFTRLANHIEKS